MRFFLNYKFALFFLFSSSFFWAQSDFKLYNSEYLLFKENFQIRNPAFGVQNDSNRNSIQFGYKALNSVSKNIRSIGIASTFCINKKEENPDTWVNLNILRDEEGVFINQNRIHLGLIKKINLSENASLLASINSGIFNFNIDGNGVVEGRNIVIPDGVSGLKLNYKTMYIGFSGAQLFEGNFVLFQNQNSLTRQFYVNLGNQFDWSKDQKIALDLYSRLPNEYTSFSLWANANYSFNSIINASILLNDLSVTVPSIGINYPYKNTEVGIQVAYSIPINIYPKVLNNNQLELLFKFKL